MRRSLRLRFFFSIFITVSIVYILAIAFILYEVQIIFTKNLVRNTTQLISSSSKYFNKIFSEDVEILRTIKNTLISLPNDDYDILIKNQNKIINSVLEETPQFLSIGINWEIYAVDSTYKKTHGRYRYLFYWKSGSIIEKPDTFDVETEAVGSLYYFFKVSKLDDITDIYYDSYTGIKEDEILMSSIGIPILKNEDFAGLVVCDISLERFNNIINEIKPVVESNTFLVSHNGNIVANSKATFINKPISKILGTDVTKYNLLFKIKEGESITYVQKDSLGHQNLVILEPFFFGKIKRTWSIGVVVPLDVIRKDADKLFNIAMILAIIGLVLMITIVSLIVFAIIKPINLAVDSLVKMSSLELDQNLTIVKSSNDELGQMSESINTLLQTLTNIKDFAFEISKGNLDAKLTVKSEKDVLGKALLEMQRSLKIANIESDKRESEEKQQRWAIDGESEISNILRQNSQDIDQLSYEVVSFLVKYSNSSQGAIFIVNNDEQEIQMLAAYAYERRKHLQKNIPFGVGLIGRAVKESETIYINDIPTGYSSISSGLGEQEPRSLLIVPFKFNEVIYAVVELNTFRDYKPNVRKFVERIGVSVASTVANLRITVTTNKLVSQLQTRSQELSSQEEQMRQNLEEMQATQDELRRKVFEAENIVNALNQVSYVVEYDMERRIISINDRFLNLLGKARTEMIGQEQGKFMTEENKIAQLNKLWNNLQLGRVSMFTQKADIDGKVIWFSEAYIPIFDDSGKPYKVINISNDISGIMERK